MKVTTRGRRRAPGVGPEMPKWMAGIDALKPGTALGLGLLLAGVNPKNLMLAAAAGAGLAQLEIATGDAAGSLIVFVIIGSLTIAGPVVYYLLGGPAAKARLDDMKNWLALHDDAVMAVLFLVFGVNLIAKGLPPPDVAPDVPGRRRIEAAHATTGKSDPTEREPTDVTHSPRFVRSS